MDVEPELSIANVHPVLRLDEGLVEGLVATVLRGESRALRYLGVILTDHGTVLELNRKYLAHDFETDVLSFLLGEDGLGDVDGEVYVDLDTASERHLEFGVSFEAEALRYVVHGLLHLMGYDDATPAGRADMRAREDKYLATLSTSGGRPER